MNMNTCYKVEYTINGRQTAMDIPYGEPTKDLEKLLNEAADNVYLQSGWYGFTGFKAISISFKAGGLSFVYGTYWARKGFWIRKIQVLVYWSGLNLSMAMDQGGER